MHPLDQGQKGVDSTSDSATVLLSGPAWPVSVYRMEINLTVREIVNVRREIQDKMSGVQDTGAVTPC